MRELGTKYFSEAGLKNKDNYLSSTARRLDESRLIKSQSENKKYDIFVSHSSRDKELIMYFKRELNTMGYSVYIDWIEDSETGRKEIIPVLKTAMTNSYSMLYIHTYNSESSKWTPWEIGYFDSKKGSKRIGVMPILRDGVIASYAGQEYLDQYSQIGVDYLQEFIRQSKQ